MPEPEADKIKQPCSFVSARLSDKPYSSLHGFAVRRSSGELPRTKENPSCNLHAVCMSSCRDSALWDRAKDHLKDTRVYQFCTTKVFPADSPSCDSARPLKKTLYIDNNMASHSYESKDGIIEIVTDDFDKVGYTKADEADMTKQNKKQQFHASFSFSFSASSTSPLC